MFLSNLFERAALDGGWIMDGRLTGRREGGPLRKNREPVAQMVLLQSRWQSL